jgi:hypothetical protein
MIMEAAIYSPTKIVNCRDPARVETEESEIQYQRLQPGVKITTRSIPYDGHQGWRKYGNKPIQNSSFCRYAKSLDPPTSSCSAFTSLHATMWHSRFLAIHLKLLKNIHV